MAGDWRRRAGDGLRSSTTFNSDSDRSSRLATVTATDLVAPTKYTPSPPVVGSRQMTLGGFPTSMGIHGSVRGPPAPNAQQTPDPPPECRTIMLVSQAKYGSDRPQPRSGTMLAYNYPLLSIFWTMLEFFLFFLWIWLLIIVFGDIFRSHDMGGLAKALWVIFVIIIPYLGVLIYLIARGGSMHERAEAQAVQQQKAFDSYVKQAAGSSGSSNVDELAKLADLKSKGVITDAEFETQKAKLLS
jgi:hypothetical protein